MGGYRYLRAVLSRAFRHASYVRVDHVMGLQRLYWIPEGFDASHGAYISYGQKSSTLSCRSKPTARAAVVVGEDLGTVPDGVRERMARDKMLRSWVFQFESSAQRPPAHTAAAMSWPRWRHPRPARFERIPLGHDIDESGEAGHLSRRGRGAREPSATTVCEQALF